MRFIHLSDPHLSSLDGRSIRSIAGKRHSGYLSWKFRRRLIYSREVLERLTTAIRAEAADQLILSGDLVQIGLEEEINEVSHWLAELAPAEQIFFVPGNHDVYARDSWAALRRHWHFVLPPPVSGADDCSTSAYPYLRDMGTVWLIGVSSACVTPVFSARGSMGQDQLDRLDTMLGEARKLGRMACLVIHHPPLPHTSSWRRALKEDRALKALISRQRPALVCYGHQHKNLEFTEGAARIFCTAPASGVQNASYRIFDIDPIEQGDRQSWSIRMRLKSIAADKTSFIIAEDKRWIFTL